VDALKLEGRLSNFDFNLKTEKAFTNQNSYAH